MRENERNRNEILAETTKTNKLIDIELITFKRLQKFYAILL